MSTPTPHNSAGPQDFAKVVLMPGDPKRAAHIAEHFLQDARLVNDVRGAQGYTGIFSGARVSVMASGMGMPSIAIHAEELYRNYGVETIIRVGTAGAISRDVASGTILIAQGASTTQTSFIRQYGLPGTFAPLADFQLLRDAADLAQGFALDYKVGNILSVDSFYDVSGGLMPHWEKMGIIGVEMETAALYPVAAYHGRKAISINMVTDNIRSGEALPAAERAHGAGVDQLIMLCLELAAQYA